MRSFTLPTRIDGCIEIRDNVTMPLNTIWNETLTTTGVMQTIVKYVEGFYDRKIDLFIC